MSKSPATSVRPWIKSVLQAHHWFGKSEPTWIDAEASKEARAKTNKLCKFLTRASRAHGSQLLAISKWIEKCSDDFCLSGLCPYCNWALQRCLVDQTSQLIANRFADEKVGMLTMICEAVNTVEEITLTPLIAKAKRYLVAAGIDIAMGSIEIDYVQPVLEGPGMWVVHFHAVVLAHNLEAAGKQLRKSVRQSRSYMEELKPFCSRPVMIKAFDGQMHGLAYLYKLQFKRRVGYLQQVSSLHGRERTRRNVSNQQLRVAEKIQLYPALHQWGLGSRLFLLGVRPTLRADDSFGIVRLAKGRSNSTSAQNKELRLEKPS